MARYYEVPVETIKSVVEDNAEEVAANGRRVLKGAELRDFAGPFGGLANLGLHHNARSLAIFSRRAVLEGERLASFKDVCQIESRARTLAIFSRREGVHDSVYPRR